MESCDFLPNKLEQMSYIIMFRKSPLKNNQ